MKLLWIAGLLFSMQHMDQPDSLELDYQGKTLVIIKQVEYVLPGSSLIDMVKLQQLLNNLDKQVYQAPVNAKIGNHQENIPEKTGHKLHRELFMDQFTSYFSGNGLNKLDIPLLTLHAKVDSELLAQIREKPIGHYITYFNANNKNRSSNISLAAKTLNNHVIFPGETFSFNQVVGKRTADRGYLQATVIVRGELSEGIGGGICQVSSTLFNSVDRAGLRIIQRYSHSRNVPYVPPGRDATVSWDGPDFTFQNQYNQPILIRSSAGAGSVIISLYSSHVIEHKPRAVPRTLKQLPEEINISTAVNQVIKPSNTELSIKPYGKLIPWQDADHAVPIKSIFTIMDYETGSTFQVQRRAGRDHADVQPLSKADSAIMKQIYQGEWSWKRRAILVHSGDEWLAASMNGMPHGGDGIPDNDFSGHFCVHFFRSTTHKTPTPDLAHQLMVYKSAGKLQAFLKAASPAVMAESFIEALSQQDLELLREASVDIDKVKFEYFIEQMNDILAIKIEKQRGLADKLNTDDSNWGELLSTEIQLKAAIQKKGGSKRTITYKFIFARQSIQSPWQLKDVQPSDYPR
ncbi:hypothetical protein EHS13_21595 [Paenibacillus psychroresistens]|uniref:Peptidoglycan binding domain-containing protein n=1 Tax=Paenibacillus psychroresistens TaxID=1778678 RepID=A0A6B8RP06_9BACL|nr:VanW family protein [Paenibacillus psychroresistens]QGQ97295.1 hypothetical protein EHS13_21595 [Paenibacillus psychroresistens]